MSMPHLLKDTVLLLKKNGKKIDDIKASVQSKKIIIMRSDILIETGDLIQRKMSNGGEETYEIIDPGFYERHSSIPAHYQITYKKLGLPEAGQAVKDITYNFYGSNSRVNNHSIDNSLNVVNLNSDINDSISQLRLEIEKSINCSEKKQEAFEIIDAVEQQFSSDKPSKTVVKTLLATLPSVASVASIGSFLLSCLGG
ncbi:hypothetical protein N0398_01040 [Providencia rettgeri]|nr:hypothetical protein [Providencia rettgeri]